MLFILGGPSVADVTDFEKAPLGFGQNYSDPKKVTPVSNVKVSNSYVISYFLLEKSCLSGKKLCYISILNYWNIRYLT